MPNISLNIQVNKMLTDEIKQIIEVIDITNEQSNLVNIYNENTYSINLPISWILYSIRQTIGLTKVRNRVLQNIIRDIICEDEIFFGQTFTQGDVFDDIYDMINDFQMSEKRYLIFTSNGEIRERKKNKRHNDQVESHYISFILDKLTKITGIIDPSRDNGKDGIYYPKIGISLESIFEQIGYKVEWLDTTYPCQIAYHDVFCQSWTLFLIIQYFKTGYFKKKCTKINIPQDQDAKYKILLDFFKELLTHKIFVKELLIFYQSNIENHIDYEYLRTINPRYLLKQMNVFQMYDY